MDYIFTGWFSDLGDYSRDRNRDHDIENDDFGEFVGRSDLFDDFFVNYGFFMRIILIYSVLFATLIEQIELIVGFFSNLGSNSVIN